VKRRDAGKTMPQDSFTVQHYSGSVTYNIAGFMQRNKGDKFDKELKSAFERSTNSVLAGIFTLLGDAEGEREKEVVGGGLHSRRAKSKITRTEVSLTKRKISEMISEMQGAHPIFIKCIQTTLPAAGGAFDEQLVTRQLRSHGVADLIRLKMTGFVESYSWEEVHIMLVANSLYHCRDQVKVSRLLSSDQPHVLDAQLAKNLFVRCKAYVNVDFWCESTRESQKGTSNSTVVCCLLQLEALEYLLFYKKSAMKDLICKCFLKYRRRKEIAKKNHSRIVLGRFFYSVKLKGQWRRSTSALLNRFLPMKLFILRWMAQFRIERRVAVSILHLFLSRRVWKERVRDLLAEEYAAVAALRDAKASLIQKRFRGHSARNHPFIGSVILVVREKLLAKKHKRMADCIFRYGLIA
jgi:hypothetical protein